MTNEPELLYTEALQDDCFRLLQWQDEIGQVGVHFEHTS
jgi:hypothetical protein